jgi:hypothetical protein
LNIPIACLCNPTRPERRVRESESDRQREEKDRPQDSDICNKREKYDQDRSKDNSTLIKSISKRHVRKEEEKSTHGMPRHPTPKI